MARRISRRQARRAIAVIVDGEDEKWYLEKVRQHYPAAALRHFAIKPDLADKKKVKELFQAVERRLNEEYSDVILIVDLDEPLKDKNETKNFFELYSKYLEVKRNPSSRHWMSRLILIVNNPCIEYWFLLHFGRTTKFYADYAALKSDLRRCPDMSGYDKSRKFYNSLPDIYMRLDGKCGRLAVARHNAMPFQPEDCFVVGTSSMNLIFDFIDTI